MNELDKVNSNYVSDVLDEIALEGLDGITLEALWMRLAVRQNFTFKIDDHSKRFLWHVIVSMSDVKFYEIPEARSSLKYYNYTISMHSKDAALELDQVYPYSSVKNVPGVYGSCQYYFTRVDITYEVIQITHEEVESRWGNKMVMVASQESRNQSLMGNFATPNIDFSKTSIHYDMLERVGRCRHLGLITCGKGSLQTIVEDPKSVFHYIKYLLQCKLIKKHSLSGQVYSSTTASRIYLPRFFEENQAENMSILQTAIEELKSRPPKYSMPCEEFYALFDPKQKERIKKYKRTALFRKYIKTTKSIPYRVLYPDATPSEWERKSKNGEKLIRCVQLVNPDVDLVDVEDKDCEVDDEEFSSDFIPRGVYFRNMSAVTQAYYHIKNSGTVGLTQIELSNKMGLNVRFIRGLTKRLTLEKSCKFYFENDGRKRFKRYIVGEHIQTKEAASEIVQILSENLKAKKQAEETLKIEDMSSKPIKSEEKFNLPQIQDDTMSYRSLKRIGLVIKTIQSHQFRLFYQIAKVVSEEEVKEGLTSRVDKRTIVRILEKLESDKIIKIITLKGKDGAGSVVKLYADPSFEPDENLKEVIYQRSLTFQPMELWKPVEECDKDLENQFSNALYDNLTKMREMMEGIVQKPGKPSNDKSGDYDLRSTPKFIRLNILHDFIFHLVYDYNGVVDKKQEELLEELAKTTAIDDDLKAEMPQLYDSQPSTYMFVPPLKNEGKVPGFFILSDLIVRMPLSVVVKVFKVSEMIPDLWKYLNHPVRKYFLLKDLPLSIRKIVFQRRHQMGSFYNDMRRLCFIGIVQFGPRLGREFYQSLAFLNRRASLMDTTPSPSGYFQVPANMTFETKSYYFNTKADVKNYWMDMFNICMATRLGERSNMIGKEIPAERELAKKSIKQLTDPKSMEKILESDNGELPGDRLGAGGLDSVLYSFLRTNWIGAGAKTKEFGKEKTLVKMPLQKLKREHAKKGKVFLKRYRFKKLVRKPEKPNLSVPETAPKPKKAMRKIKEREYRCKRRKQSSYDEVDLEALKLMNTLRVTWSTAEDNLLLICRVAMLFLCPNTRTYVRIPWVEVRKALQEYLPESRNKTQKAISRRIKFMLKNPTTERSVNLCLEELKEMPETVKRFDCSDMLNDMKPSAPDLHENEAVLYEKFHELVSFLKTRFIDNIRLDVRRTNQDMIPDSLEEFMERFQVEATPEFSLNVKEIRENVIRGILMSSLSCRTDKTSSAVHLFDIYRQYHDDELQNAVKNLHYDKVLTIRKNAGSAVFKTGKVVPLSSTPYKLSFSFKHMMTMKFTHSIYADTFSQINQLLQEKSEEEAEVDLNDCNLALFLLASKGLISFKANIPEHIISLDSGEVSDKTYSKMLERYCEILSLSNDNSKIVCSSGKIITKSKEKETLAGQKRKLSDSEEVDKKKQKVDEKEQLLGEKSTRSSRVILYIMREEAKKEAQNESDKPQEACVVNAAKVVKTFNKDEVEAYAKEMDPKVASIITKKIISRLSVPLNLVDEQSVLEKFKAENLTETAKRVLEFIESKEELGVSGKELTDNFEKEDLVKVLKCLMEDKVVIKSGITETRYVSQKHSTSWLLSSFKMTRLEREKVKPSDVTAVALVGTGCEDIPGKKMKGVISSEELKSEKYQPPACSSDSNNKVKVIIRPWVRIDGSLNRKVLDRFLGTILSFTLSNVGITLKGIMNKFAPSITPIWTKDLVEILAEIGCISYRTLVVKQKSSLFTKATVEVSSEFTGLEDDDSVIVEPKIDAVTTLGLFIGKKTYSRDFLVD